MKTAARDVIFGGERPMRRWSRHLAVGAFELFVFMLATVALAVLLVRLR